MLGEEIMISNALDYGVIEYRGLSTDNKPTNAKNGSVFVEMDTGKIFIFDEENAQWRAL